MCAKVIYVLLGGLFVYVTSTIAAFAYLDWWQAILVSMLVFVLMVFISKTLLKRYVRSMGRRAQEFLNQRAGVLRGATLEVHSIKPASMPKEVAENLLALEAPDDEDDDEPDPKADQDYADRRWHTIEATIFPAPPPDTKRRTDATWDPHGLRIVPLEAKRIEFMKFKSDEEETPECDLWELELIEEGSATRLADDTDSVIGPRRLRFVVGTPPKYRLLKMQYFTEHFGRMELPSPFGNRS